VEVEWDERKRLATIEKHQIDFREAAFVFEVDHLVLEGNSTVEPRMIAVGQLDGVLIAVVFTMRGNAVRIITARRARSYERRAYREVYSGTASPHERSH
jgi:uncharacterized protein